MKNFVFFVHKKRDENELIDVVSKLKVFTGESLNSHNRKISSVLTSNLFFSIFCLKEPAVRIKISDLNTHSVML